MFVIAQDELCELYNYRLFFCNLSSSHYANYTTRPFGYTDGPRFATRDNSILSASPVYGRRQVDLVFRPSSHNRATSATPDGKGEDHTGAKPTWILAHDRGHAEEDRRAQDCANDTANQQLADRLGFGESAHQNWPKQDTDQRNNAADDPTDQAGNAGADATGGKGIAQDRPNAGEQ